MGGARGRVIGEVRTIMRNKPEITMFDIMRGIEMLGVLKR